MLFATVTTTYWTWSRLQSLREWWQWPVLLLSIVAVLAFTAWLHRRDTVELPRAARYTLLTLRGVALLVLLLFFLGLERRSEQKTVRPSRLAILVDTSQSMGMNDDTEPTTSTRMERVQALFEADDWLNGLQRDHEVAVYATGSTETPEALGILRQMGPSATPDASARPTDAAHTEPSLTLPGLNVVLPWRTPLLVAGSVLFGLFLWSWWRGQEGSAAWYLAGAVAGWLMGGTVWAAHELLQTPAITAVAGETDQSATIEEASPAPDWVKSLAPRHDGTRLGDSLFSILQLYRAQPLAGIVVLSDGAQNQGKDPLTITPLARQATVPIFAVGLGTSQLPRNVSLADLQLPPRVYPQDQFYATVYVQGSQMSGRQVELQLYAKPVAPESAGATAAGGGPVVESPPQTASQLTGPAAGETLIDTQLVTLGEDHQLISARFDLEPPGAGTWAYRAVLVPVAQEADPSDNMRTARVTVVDRRTRVLLVAGGPTREYHFVRNQLFRDPSMQSDTWLQTSKAGTAQEAQQVLSAFPSTAEELFAYDCIVAFDPDWTQLQREQLELCERWVSEEAGGLLVIAGPVHTHRWAEADVDPPGFEKLRALYPVDFYRRGRGGAQLGRTSSDKPWPLQFSAEGGAARFLWLGDSASESAARWAAFPGFYGYFATRGVKPGATVFASFSDPETEIRGQLPPYLVGQFYGSGRTLFLASGELWRLRALDVAYQEQLYTKLVRYVSEGRLLRDSERGILLLDRQRCTRGERITVRAQLKDVQLRPWQAAQAEAMLAAPDGTRQTLTLPASPEAPGAFQTTFVTEQAGTYVVTLQIPDADEYQRLTREVEVRLADRELEQPLRDDQLLREIARDTGGAYFVGVPAVLGQRGIPPLAQNIRPRQQISVVEGAADSQFDARWMKWLMIFLSGSLCIEWLVRRLYRLA